MAFEKLTSDQLAGARKTRVSSPYQKFLTGLHVGEGGRATTEAEGVSRQSIKNRLKTAAAASDMQIKFRRAANNEVIFEVLSAPERPRRGRRPKSEMTSAAE